MSFLNLCFKVFSDALLLFFGYLYVWLFDGFLNAYKYLFRKPAVNQLTLNTCFK